MTYARTLGWTLVLLLIRPSIVLAADPDLLDAAYARFTKAYETLDPEMVGNLYTMDARYLGPASDIRRGREAITRNFKEYFDQTRAKGATMTIRFTSDDRVIDGSLAYDVGYYDLTRTEEDGSIHRDRGKFVTVWKRDSQGNWLIHVDSYNPVPDGD